MTEEQKKRAEQVVLSWKSDWQPIFEYICTETGMTLEEALAYYRTMASAGVMSAQRKHMERLDTMWNQWNQLEKPKEPWED